MYVYIYSPILSWLYFIYFNYEKFLPLPAKMASEKKEGKEKSKVANVFFPLNFT